MAKHVCCITTSLLGVDVYFATQVAILTWPNSRVMWTTWLPFGLFCYTSAIAEVQQNKPPDLLETFTISSLFKSAQKRSVIKLLYQSVGKILTLNMFRCSKRNYVLEQTSACVAYNNPGSVQCPSQHKISHFRCPPMRQLQFLSTKKLHSR